MKNTELQGCVEGFCTLSQKFYRHNAHPILVSLIFVQNKMIQVCLDFKEDLCFFGNPPNQKTFTLIQKTAKHFRKTLTRSVHNRAKIFIKSPPKICIYVKISEKKNLDF